MAKDIIHDYRRLIKRLLTQHAQQMKQQPAPGLDTELVFDEEYDHLSLE